jgi:hypothetical protein
LSPECLIFYLTLQIVNFLLQDPRIDPTVFDNFAVRVACENGHEKVVAMLLKDARVNPAAQNNYAVVAAVKNGHIEGTIGGLGAFFSCFFLSFYLLFRDRPTHF